MKFAVWLFAEDETDVQFACFSAAVSATATARVDFAFARSDKRRQISRRKLPPSSGHRKTDDLPTAELLSPSAVCIRKCEAANLFAAQFLLVCHLSHVSAYVLGICTSSRVSSCSQTMERKTIMMGRSVAGAARHVSNE